MRLAKHSITRSLAVLVAVLLAMPGLTTAAQPSATHQAGAATVTFGDTWKLQPDYSTSDNVFLMHDTLPATAFAYLETNEFGTTLVDAVLESFAMGFTSTFDPGTMHVVASGVTPDATAWRLYAATASGIPAAMLITANTSVQPGMAVLSLLMAPSGSFDIALDDARGDVQIDGAPALGEIDPAQLLVALEGDADAAIQAQAPTPSAGPVSTSTPIVAQGPAVVDGVDYRALDAPTGCDRIGWAITDPSQLPASEPDLDHRGACAGGASYVAQCGTVPGERTDTRYITCEITALVTDGPQEFAYDMFELFDADGDSEYIDFGMSFGKEELFPDGAAPEDATVSGTASFAIDGTATEPLLLEIRPPSLPEGIEPAVLVIEGPLQELAVFG